MNCTAAEEQAGSPACGTLASSTPSCGCWLPDVARSPSGAGRADGAKWARLSDGRGGQTRRLGLIIPCRTGTFANSSSCHSEFREKSRLGARLSLQPQRTSATIVNARTTHCLVHHFSVLDLYGLCIFGRPDCHNRVDTASVCRLAAVRSVTPARQRPDMGGVLSRGQGEAAATTVVVAAASLTG